MAMDLTKEFVNSCRKVGVLRDFLCQAIDQVDEKDKEIAKLKEQYKDMDVTHTVHIAKMNARIEELEFYLKYEADKVIAELQKQVHDYAQGLYVIQARAEKEARHQKYKRCLAMARWCESEAYIHEHGSDYDEDLAAWFGKWHKRWLELAEKFKEYV